MTRDLLQSSCGHPFLLAPHRQPQTRCSSPPNNPQHRQGSRVGVGQAIVASNRRWLTRACPRSPCCLRLSSSPLQGPFLKVASLRLCLPWTNQMLPTSQIAFIISIIHLLSMGRLSRLERGEFLWIYRLDLLLGFPSIYLG